MEDDHVSFQPWDSTQNTSVDWCFWVNIFGWLTWLRLILSLKKPLFGNHRLTLSLLFGMSSLSAVKMLCHITISKGNLLCTLCKLPWFATLENAKRFHIIHVDFLVEVAVRTLFSPLVSLLMKKGREYNPMRGSHNSYSAIVLFVWRKLWLR